MTDYYKQPFGQSGAKKRPPTKRERKLTDDRRENEATIREHFDRSKLDPYDNAHGLDREDPHHE